MTLSESAESDIHFSIADLKWLEIPDYWLEQRPGVQEPTESVNLAYLEHIATQITSSGPISYDIWKPALHSLYGTISHSSHEGAHRLWIAFLRKGIAGLSHLITRTTPEFIATEVTRLASWAVMRDTPKQYRASQYWHTGSTASRWYCNLERMLATDAGITREQIIALGEEMLVNVSIPFERVGYTMRGGTSITDLTESVVRAIETAKIGNSFSQNEWDDSKFRAQQRVEAIARQLADVKIKR